MAALDVLIWDMKAFCNVAENLPWFAQRSRSQLTAWLFNERIHRLFHHRKGCWDGATCRGCNGNPIKVDDSRRGGRLRDTHEQERRGWYCSRRVELLDKGPVNLESKRNSRRIPTYIGRWFLLNAIDQRQ
jgi:hypothetical protein